MNDLEKLRMELKSDVELIVLSQGESARRMTEIKDQVEQQGQKIVELGQQIAEHSQLTAQLAREVAENSRWMQGRMRLLGQRFDTVLGLLASEHGEDRSLLQQLEARQEDLERRVSRLEDGPSAA